MSDFAQGPGWWQASDGKWYPPGPAPSKKGVPRWNLWVVAVVSWVVGLFMGFALAGPADDNKRDVAATETQSPASTAAATTTTVGTPETVTVSLPGNGNSNAFALRGGRYKISYDYGGECYYGAGLHKTEGDPAGTDLPNGDGPMKGEATLFEVEGGEYFVEMITGPAPSCPWSVTLSTV